MIIKPKLTLVGAGPGDPELITLKGLKALQNANVIVYDALANAELLNHIPARVPTIFVGKRKGHHEFSQKEINELIVRLALKEGNVVRLKGGDPFVFGRGFEEIVAAKNYGIETEYIPGVSSAVAVPGLQGIPVTHRGSSESFWVITGTTSAGEVSEDVRAAAITQATVVILMGMGQLSKIVEIFLEAGRCEMPMAIIQNGSLNHEKTAVGTVDTILQIADEKKIGTPAVIVTGETVRLHKDFPDRWRELELLISDLKKDEPTAAQ